MKTLSALTRLLLSPVLLLAFLVAGEERPGHQHLLDFLKRF